MDYYEIKKTEKELAKMTGWNKDLGVDNSSPIGCALLLSFLLRYSIV